PGAAIVDARGHHGKADPVAGDRGAVHDAGAVIMAGDLQLPGVVRPGGDGDHLAYVGDDAGEHFHVLSKGSRVSAATGSMPSERSCGEADNAVTGKPSSGPTPPGPISVGPRNSTASSTRSVARNAAATVGPPSTITRVMPCAARSPSTANRSSLPELLGGP